MSEDTQPVGEHATTSSPETPRKPNGQYLPDDGLSEPVGAGDGLGAGAGDAMDDAWRADLPTEVSVQAKPTSVYSPAALRALARLHRANLEGYLDLANQIVGWANVNADVTAAKLTTAVKEIVGDLKREDRQESVSTEQKKPLPVALLDWLASLSELFIDQYKQVFIEFTDPGTGIWRSRPVRHDEVLDLLIACPLLDKAPPPDVMETVVRTLEAQARRSSRTRKVCVRVGWHDDELYIDRAAADGTVIRVSGMRGVSVIAGADCEIRFLYDIAQAEIPVPVSGGSIDELWKFIRVLRPQDQCIVKGILVGAFAPTGPYAGLGVYGLHGSSKTMTMEMLASLIDPSQAEAGRMSEREENTMISVQTAWLLVFDNMTSLTEEQSNLLCRLVQGTTFKTRLLYTNNRQIMLHAERPVMVNGITQFVTRPDLIDRFVTITLDRIPAPDRERRTDIRRRFDQARPRLLGALLAAIADGLSRPQPALPHLPRMADHVAWASRCEQGLGMPPGGYLDAFEANARTGAVDAVESSYLGAAVVQMQASRGGADWSATPRATLNELKQYVSGPVQRSTEWPSNEVWLTRRLKPLVPALEHPVTVKDARGAYTSERQIVIRGQALDTSSAIGIGQTVSGPAAAGVVQAAGAVSRTQPEILSGGGVFRNFTDNTGNTVDATGSNTERGNSDVRGPNRISSRIDSIAGIVSKIPENSPPEEKNVDVPPELRDEFEELFGENENDLTEPPPPTKLVRRRFPVPR